MNKIMKYQIIKPMDADWQIFGQVLNDLKYDTRQVFNKSIQLCWEYQGFSADYKKEHGVYPKTEDILNYKTVMGYAYDSLKHDYNKFNSGNYTATVKKACDKWKSDLKEVSMGDKNPPTYKKDCPVDLHNKSLALINEDGNYYFNLSLISNKYKKEIERKSGQFMVLVKVGDNNQKSILNKVLSGEYKISASQIIKKGSKWFVYLSYSFTPSKKQLDSNRILGVDLGITNAATLQIWDCTKEKWDRLGWRNCILDGRELIHFRQKFQQRKRALQSSLKINGITNKETKGKKGRGRNTLLKPLDKLSEKESNFRDTMNHKYSKYIVDFAIRNNCGVIQMEDLKGFTAKAKESFLKSWTYFDLQSKIEYKAQENGIEVIKVKPNYTSKRCSHCGCIDDENRDCKNNQAKFKCVICGHEENADINAAKNIALPNIENIITDQLEVMKK